MIPFSEFESRVKALTAEYDNKLSILQRRVAQLERGWLPNPSDIPGDASFHERFARKVTGVVGLQEIVQSPHSIGKYIWIFLFLCGCGATIFFTYMTTVEYFQEPTATKVKVNVSAFYDLPPIALCPAAWVDTDKALSLGLSLDGLKYSLGYINTWSEIKFKDTHQPRSDFLAFYNSQNFSSLADFYKAISIDLPTVYSSRAFRNLSVGVRLNDEHSALLEKVFLHYQTCYTYSFRAFGRALSTTAYAAVKFFDRSKGVVRILPDLWIQMRPDKDLILSPLLSVYAFAYYRTKVLITAQRLVTLASTNTGCIDPGNDTYSETVCAAQCQNKEYKKVINCKVFRYSLDTDPQPPEEYCNFMEPLYYNNWTFSDFTGSDINEKITNDCSIRCPMKCDRTVFQMHMQWQQPLAEYANYSLWYYQDQAANVSQAQPSYFEIYIEHAAKYDGAVLEFFEVNTYSFTELMNNVGGTFGLFVGATMMTFAQVILFFLEYMFPARGKDEVSSVV